MTPDPAWTIGEVLKQYILPVGLAGAGLVVVACILAGGAVFLGLFEVGRAMRAAVQWRPRLTLDELLRKIRAGAPLLPSDYEYSLSFTSESLSLKSCRDSAAPECNVLWRDICRVVAFRQESFRYDYVCLRFTLSCGAEVELNEGMLGWSDLVRLIPDVLPGSASVRTWVRGEALPIDAADVLLIYDRSAPGISEDIHRSCN